MRILAALAMLILTAALPMQAADDQAGEFDYYVLSLSWTPNWCDREGSAASSPQCARDAGYGWVLHGLWPQHNRGWPSYCPTAQTPPSRAITRAVTDITGSSGLAWHQWRKHGVCSGLAAETYFQKARAAYEAIRRPAILRDLDRAVMLPAALIEQAFLRENPGLEPDMLTVTCARGQIEEVRICLTKDLRPRVCAADIRKDCPAKSALFLPIGGAN